MEKKTIKEIKKIGHYNLCEFIDKGAFGEVWCGINTIYNKLVAIKIIKHKQLKNDIEKYIKNEIDVLRIFSKKNNPNIVNIYQYLKDDCKSYIVMEYCNSGNLRKLLLKEKHFLEDQAVEFFKQILNGLNGVYFFSFLFHSKKLIIFFYNLSNKRI